MSNYNKATNFSVKDTLTSGDPDKVVSGAEIDNEFDAISSAVGSKADKVTAATTDNLAALDSNGNLKDSGENKESVVAIAAPVGSVVMHAAASAPSGWLECDGSEISRSTYSELFNSIGTSFGAGDGSSTFALPDLRGEFVRGWDNGRGIDSGRSLGSEQLDQMQRVTGDFNFASNMGIQAASGSFGREDFISDGNNRAEGTGMYNKVTFDSSNAPNAKAGDETRPRNIALMYIIKT